MQWTGSDMTGIEFYISNMIYIQKIVLFSFPFVYCFVMQNINVYG